MAPPMPRFLWLLLVCLVPFGIAALGEVAISLLAGPPIPTLSIEWIAFSLHKRRPAEIGSAGQFRGKSRREMTGR